MAFSRPLLHFDSFGPVDIVLHDVETRIPRVFPTHASHFVTCLKKMVRHHSNLHGWQTVVLSVTQGMPEEALETFLTMTPGHRGPVIIDPTLVNPHEKIYDDTKAVKADSENLTMLCQCSDDVLAVLYGIDGIDPHKSVQLLQARLRMLDMTFELLKTDIAADPSRGLSRDAPESVKRLDLANNILEGMSAALTRTFGQDLSLDAKAITPAIIALRNELAFIMMHGADPEVLHTLHVSDQQLENIPQQYKELNLMPLVEAPEVKPHAPGLHHPTHDLRHMLYDEMNPKPKMD